jgi:hypothetical protein
LGDDCWYISNNLYLKIFFVFSQIGIYMQTFVAEAFFEQIRIDLENKTEKALSGTELWNTFCEVPGCCVVLIF